MFRSLLMCPAGVSVRVVFDEQIDDSLYSAVRQSWASMHPVEQEFNGPLSEPGLVLVTSRNYSEVAAPLREKGEEVPAIVHVVEEDLAQERLTVEVTMRILQALAGELNLFHAAALGDERSRRAMILVGPSGRGKTTASRFLGQHFAYLSDETAVVQPDFYLRPYPKPLSVIERQGKPKVQHDPGCLGLKVVAFDDFSYRLHRVVLLDRQETPVPPRLEPVELADSLIEIVQQTSGLVKTEDGVMKLIELIQGCGGASRLIYHEISETLSLLESALAEENSGQGEGEKVTHVAPVPTEVLQPGMVQRPKASSGFWAGDRLLVLNGQQFFELSTFAADCWDSLNKPKSVTQLKDELEKLYGEIPQEDFERVLSQLEESRVLDYCRAV